MWGTGWPVASASELSESWWFCSKAFKTPVSTLAIFLFGLNDAGGLVGNIIFLIIFLIILFF